MNAEGTPSAWGKEQDAMCIVAGLRAFEGFAALGVLSQTAESEVLEAYDAAVLNTGEIH